VDVIQDAVKKGEILRYLVKPWDHDELMKTISRALKRSLKDKRAAGPASRNAPIALASENLANIDRISDDKPTGEPGWTRHMLGLVRAVEARDPYTMGHSSRVAELSLCTGEKLGLSQEEEIDLEMGALLHDIGKITITDSILFKPSKLLPGELSVIREHTIIGEELLIKQAAPQKICSIVRCHHENYDGSGYPDGISGGAIPLGSRIIRLADTFDAMYHKRTYRNSRSIDVIIDEIERGAGIEYDPGLVTVFLSMIEENADRIGKALDDKESRAGIGI
jgi:putative nucleotidyltransferase with HDIG domain